jgi:CheY-like chemotaxis protein
VKSSRPALSQRATVTAKPKVLLVDDHPDILRAVSRLLAFDFEVVGTASDAHQALDASQRADPDVVVLDITMPGRDGFQIAQDLKREGSRARIVFLSMHEADEFVAQAFQSGGLGYVLKTRVHTDLVHGVKRVLAGQLSVPSLKSLFVIDDHPTGHAVHFYIDQETWVEGVGSFLISALRRGDAVAVVSPEPIRASLAKRLKSSGWSVGESETHGPYRAVDTADAVSAIMRDGCLDTGRVAEMVAELDRFRVATRGPQSRLTVVGDIAGRFFESGYSDNGMQLERLWNDLTRNLPFLTVCCYSEKCFSEDTHTDLFPHLCGEHHVVAHSPDDGMRPLRN